MPDHIHNQGLRLALGAFRTSPVASLYVEADEPSLYSRREKLSLQYAIRLAANPLNPAHEVTFPPNNVNLYEQKPKAIKSFGIRISPLLESANIKPQNNTGPRSAVGIVRPVKRDWAVLNKDTPMDISI